VKKINKKVLLIAAVFIFGGILVLTLFKTDYFFPLKPVVQEGYYIGNLHTHTLASDGKMTYQELIDTAKSLNFNFIAITDHNTISPEVKSLCPEEKEILCIIGEEISSKEGHILAIDINDIILKNLTPEETIEKIHQQGGLAIPAHPERQGGLTIKRVKELPFDAVECNLSTKTEKYQYSCELLPEFPRVYNSDAHKKEDLKKLANRCLFNKLNINSLKEAVKKRNCFEFLPALKQ